MEWTAGTPLISFNKIVFQGRGRLAGTAQLVPPFSTDQKSCLPLLTTDFEIQMTRAMNVNLAMKK